MANNRYNLEDAKVALVKKKEESLKTYCPLIKDMCRPDCVCWIEGRITRFSTYKPKEGEEETYFIRGNECGNYMFFGEC
jgi:hypothetical protein